MVVSALTTVSPESSSTIRSTPCVLGCCGPMLTVIVSVRSSAVDIVFSCQSSDVSNQLQVRGCGGCQRAEPLLHLPLHQRADGVNDCPMHSLHARRGLVGHVNVNRGDSPRRSSVASRQ